MIFDSHAHYDDERFDADREELLNLIKASGITKIVNAASSYEASLACIALAEKYDFIYASVGVHPHAAKEMNDEMLKKLSELCNHKRVVAVGEIGLDYYYDNSPRDVQKLWYDRQLSMAEELNLPVIIHDRDAHGDIMDILKKHPAVRGVMHCFSGSREMAEELVKMGFYISFSGSVTFKNARKIVEAAAIVPDDRILIETDCPYLAPVPHRGERNSSLLITDTARILAGIRGTTFDDICSVTYKNACQLFNLESCI